MTEINKWHPPDPGFAKINFDGCVARKNSVAGFKVRDENGCPLVVGARSLGMCTITVAEAFAL